MIVTFDPRFKPWMGASDDDTRPALRGVNVDPSGLLVATNTHLLVVVPCEITDAPLNFAGCSIPADWLRDVARFKNRKSSHFTLDIDVEKRTVEAFTRLGTVRTGIDTEVKFPRWRRVLPDLSTTPITSVRCIQPRYVALLTAALDLGSKFTFFTPEALGPVFVPATDGAFGVVMPMDPEANRSGQDGLLTEVMALIGRVKGQETTPVSVPERVAVAA